MPDYSSKTLWKTVAFCLRQEARQHASQCLGLSGGDSVSLDASHPGSPQRAAVSDPSPQKSAFLGKMSTPEKPLKVPPTILQSCVVGDTATAGSASKEEPALSLTPPPHAAAAAAIGAEGAAALLQSENKAFGAGAVAAEEDEACYKSRVELLYEALHKYVALETATAAAAGELLPRLPQWWQPAFGSLLLNAPLSSVFRLTLLEATSPSSRRRKQLLLHEGASLSVLRLRKKRQQQQQGERPFAAGAAAALPHAVPLHTAAVAVAAAEAHTAAASRAAATWPSRQLVLAEAAAAAAKAALSNEELLRLLHIHQASQKAASHYEALEQQEEQEAQEGREQMQGNEFERQSLLLLQAHPHVVAAAASTEGAAASLTSSFGSVRVSSETAGTALPKTAATPAAAHREAVSVRNSLLDCLMWRCSSLTEAEVWKASREALSLCGVSVCLAHHIISRALYFALPHAAALAQHAAAICSGEKGRNACASVSASVAATSAAEGDTSAHATAARTPAKTAQLSSWIREATEEAWQAESSAAIEAAAAAALGKLQARATEISLQHALLEVSVIGRMGYLYLPLLQTVAKIHIFFPRAVQPMGATQLLLCCSQFSRIQEGDPPLKAFLRWSVPRLLAAVRHVPQPPSPQQAVHLLCALEQMRLRDPLTISHLLWILTGQLQMHQRQQGKPPVAASSGAFPPPLGELQLAQTPDTASSSSSQSSGMHIFRRFFRNPPQNKFGDVFRTAGGL
ncbi:hypothetical protein cyc_08751 [Cyclospora cayetanensis]|uniref:Uncharacterized protein n=1 Tax=Cyclospora cayetanensis TaxID=88456 RepID=A0A1D3D1E3_9EIME|nr:hypothetical protein cyc_08751 [Cyclospora cayetanensis]